VFDPGTPIDKPIDILASTIFVAALMAIGYGTFRIAMRNDDRPSPTSPNSADMSDPRRP
jgi:hypothetical protein